MKAVKNGSIKWTHKDGTVQFYPIVEATEPLVFTVTEKDLARSESLKGYADPNCCVAACAVRRQFTDAIFQRDTAYTLQVREGKVCAVRYRFGSSLRKAVASFDAGGLFTTGDYKLLAPTHTQTLKAKAARLKKYTKKKRVVRSPTKFTARGKVTPLS